jgi:hypothetical protein
VEPPIKESFVSEAVDRRGFIRRVSAGAAAVGTATVVGPALLGDSRASAVPAARGSDQPVLDGTDVVAHVVDARTGEMSIMVGTREVKLVNRDLAQQLMRATR